MKLLSVVILPSGRTAFSFKVKTPSDSAVCKFKVIADPDNKIRESNEDNNVWSGRLLVSTFATDSYFYNELYSKEAFYPGTHISKNFASELASHAENGYKISYPVKEALNRAIEGRFLPLEDINELRTTLQIMEIKTSIDMIHCFIPTPVGVGFVYTMIEGSLSEKMMAVTWTSITIAATTAGTAIGGPVGGLIAAIIVTGIHFECDLVAEIANKYSESEIELTKWQKLELISNKAESKVSGLHRLYTSLLIDISGIRWGDGAVNRENVTSLAKDMEREAEERNNITRYFKSAVDDYYRTGKLLGSYFACCRNPKDEWRLAWPPWPDGVCDNCGKPCWDARGRIIPTIAFINLFNIALMKIGIISEVDRIKVQSPLLTVNDVQFAAVEGGFNVMANITNLGFGGNEIHKIYRRPTTPPIEVACFLEGPSSSQRSKNVELPESFGFKWVSFRFPITNGSYRYSVVAKWPANAEFWNASTLAQTSGEISVVDIVKPEPLTAEIYLKTPTDTDVKEIIPNKKYKVNPSVTLAFGVKCTVEPITYEWKLIGGSVIKEGEKRNFSLSIAKGGNYTVNLTVEDNWGRNATDEVDIHVNEEVVTSTETSSKRSSPIRVLVNEEIKFDASRCYDPEGFDVRYLWDFGDGSSSTDATVKHAYTKAGDYTVVLKATDEMGLVSQTEIPVTVLKNPELVLKPSHEGSLNHTTVGGVR